MHYKYFLILCAGFSVAALPGVVQAVQADGTSNTARIRVYQQADITLYPGEYCYGSKNPEAIKASETGFSIFDTHKRVGMPETADIPGAYNEYVMRAGRPITVMLQWQAEKNGVKASCGPIGSTFYPQAGKDYDVTLGYSGSCFVQIRELYETAPGKASARMAASSYSFPCAGH
ncbi:MAG: hypothetical protein ACOH1I_08265 [Gallionellaceae bacterium]